MMWPYHNSSDLGRYGMTPMRPVAGKIVFWTAALPLPHLPTAPGGRPPIVVAGCMMMSVMMTMVMFG